MEFLVLDRYQFYKPSIIRKADPNVKLSLKNLMNFLYCFLLVLFFNTISD